MFKCQGTSQIELGPLNVDNVMFLEEHCKKHLDVILCYCGEKSGYLFREPRHKHSNIQSEGPL